MGKNQSKAKKSQSPEKYDFDILLKIMLLGDAKVGKTSIARQYIEGKFDKRYIPTIGVDFFFCEKIQIDKTKHFLIQNKPKISLQLWDTAGEQRFCSLDQSFFKMSDGAVLVYDTNRIETLRNLKTQHFSIAQKNISGTKLMVLGNDISGKDSKVIEEAENYAKQKGIKHQIIKGQNYKEVRKVILDAVWDVLATKIKILAKKDVFMTFLLAINEDFDDDLLQDALQLLVDL